MSRIPTDEGGLRVGVQVIKCAQCNEKAFHVGAHEDSYFFKCVACKLVMPSDKIRMKQAEHKVGSQLILDDTVDELGYLVKGMKHLANEKFYESASTVIEALVHAVGDPKKEGAAGRYAALVACLCEFTIGGITSLTKYLPSVEHEEGEAVIVDLNPLGED